MCNRKVQNEKVSVGVVRDKANRPVLITHSEELCRHFITDT